MNVLSRAVADARELLVHVVTAAFHILRLDGLMRLSAATVRALLPWNWRASRGDGAKALEAAPGEQESGQSPMEMVKEVRMPRAESIEDDGSAAMRKKRKEADKMSPRVEDADGVPTYEAVSHSLEDEFLSKKPKHEVRPEDDEDADRGLFDEFRRPEAATERRVEPAQGGWSVRHVSWVEEPEYRVVKSADLQEEEEPRHVAPRVSPTDKTQVDTPQSSVSWSMEPEYEAEQPREDEPSASPLREEAEAAPSYEEAGLGGSREEGRAAEAPLVVSDWETVDEGSKHDGAESIKPSWVEEPEDSSEVTRDAIALDSRDVRKECAPTKRAQAASELGSLDEAGEGAGESILPPSWTEEPEYAAAVERVDLDEAESEDDVDMEPQLPPELESMENTPLFGCCANEESQSQSTLPPHEHTLVRHEEMRHLPVDGAESVDDRAPADDKTAEELMATLPQVEEVREAGVEMSDAAEYEKPPNEMEMRKQRAEEPPAEEPVEREEEKSTGVEVAETGGDESAVTDPFGLAAAYEKSVPDRATKSGEEQAALLLPNVLGVSETSSSESKAEGRDALGMAADYEKQVVSQGAVREDEETTRGERFGLMSPLTDRTPAAETEGATTDFARVPADGSLGFAAEYENITPEDVGSKATASQPQINQGEEQQRRSTRQKLTGDPLGLLAPYEMAFHPPADDGGQVETSGKSEAESRDREEEARSINRREKSTIDPLGLTAEYETAGEDLGALGKENESVVVATAERDEVKPRGDDGDPLMLRADYEKAALSEFDLQPEAEPRREKSSHAVDDFHNSTREQDRLAELLSWHEQPLKRTMRVAPVAREHSSLPKALQKLEAPEVHSVEMTSPSVNAFKMALLGSSLISSEGASASVSPPQNYLEDLMRKGHRLKKQRRETVESTATADTERDRELEEVESAEDGEEENVAPGDVDSGEEQWENARETFDEESEGLALAAAAAVASVASSAAAMEVLEKKLMGEPNEVDAASKESVVSDSSSSSASDISEEEMPPFMAQRMVAAVYYTV